MKKKSSKIDPLTLMREREALKRRHRKSVFFNDRELAAIDEYCRKFKVSSRSALIRQATMTHILESLDEAHPTLF